NGVAYLHDAGAVHGDIKASNVLISHNGTAKLADFGNARLQNSTLVYTGPHTASAISTRWTAPELLTDGGEYTKTADIYALGMTVLEVLTGDVPFADLKHDPAVITRVVVQSRMPERPERSIPSLSKHGDDLWALLLQCWSYDPQARPSATHVV
ncbi:hypothetical protein FRC06_011220, partial [Ceratobasidium sp. 370]